MTCDDEQGRDSDESESLDCAPGRSSAVEVADLRRLIPGPQIRDQGVHDLNGSWPLIRPVTPPVSARAGCYNQILDSTKISYLARDNVASDKIARRVHGKANPMRRASQYDVAGI